MTETARTELPAAAMPAVLDLDPAAEIAALALRHRRAEGPLIQALNRVGGTVEAQVRLLPPAVRQRVERIVDATLARALRASRLGRLAPRTGPRGARLLVALSGAAGGLGGLPTALAELPFTVTVILHAIAREAEAAGFDPAQPGVQAEILRVLSQGSPLPQDDGLDLAFVGARLAVSGAALQRIIAAVAPSLAMVLTQRLAASAVPVLGAAAGAALNTAYITYFQELAAVRFGLLRLSVQHGAERVIADFARAIAPPRLRV